MWPCMWTYVSWFFGLPLLEFWVPVSSCLIVTYVRAHIELADICHCIDRFLWLLIGFPWVLKSPELQVSVFRPWKVVKLDIGAGKSYDFCQLWSWKTKSPAWYFCDVISVKSWSWNMIATVHMYIQHLLPHVLLSQLILKVINDTTIIGRDFSVFLVLKGPEKVQIGNPVLMIT